MAAREDDTALTARRRLAVPSYLTAKFAKFAKEALVELEKIGRAIVESALKVHSAIGPGLLESAYIACLAYELHDRGLKVQTEVPLPVIYRGVKLEVGYRLDLVVEEKVILEVKAMKKLHPVHSAQLLSYLRLGDRRLGFLLNFHEQSMKDGIKRMVNNY